MVPEAVGELTTSEQLVLDALREQLPDGAVVLPQLRLTDDRGDREADVVVVWPGVGVAVIEVKGGTVEHVAGEWLLHAGGRTRSVHPVAQAREAKYRIRSVLHRHPRYSGGTPRMAHHVVVPFTTLPADFAVPECPRSGISDRDDVPRLASRLRAQLDALVDGLDPPAEAQARSLVAALTGPQTPQLSMAERILGDVLEREQHCEVLTAPQAKVLDLLGEHPRVHVRGGAGSGKTWVAVEQVRRLAGEGQRVALLCFSRGLATWLARRVTQLPAQPAYVGTFHSLGIGWGAPPQQSAGPEFFEHELPAAMRRLAAGLDDSERFDAIVVDEAQDFAASWWDPLMLSLRDPERGKVTVFSDEGQRVFDRVPGTGGGFVTATLGENLRNTVPIAEAFTRYAPEPATLRGGAGAPVRSVACTPEDAVERADAEVERLLEQGWAPEHVALLTTGSRHPEQASRVEHLGTAGYWESFWDTGDVFYGHVLGTKGLERPAVVLAVNGFREPERERELRYVGMSRARDLLVVCG